MSIDLDKKFQDKERKLYKMKKLLNLLSILTITITSMPNVIAKSNYKKEEKLENTKQ